MALHIPFDNSYARLPGRLYTELAPTPVRTPALVALNDGLAERLGLDPAALTTPEAVAMLAGNAVPEGAAPLAQAYAGHQFGVWNPQLGDGRAILLGEVVAPDGARFDIQLKGSGRTPYSRMGDGRAWLGPVLREYIVSEGMAALGVPTTRALAAVTTGEPVLREAPLPGAVLTRVASSHIRVGTFQFFAARGDAEALAALAEYARARHYPGAEGVEGLLDGAVARQAELVTRWMGLGFIHGVMNTDNMAVSGETIDYGPCAFMDAYHPGMVFSSIDQQGRYAYGNQPQIALWNLAQFATALVPLMPDEDEAVERFTQAINRFVPRYQAAWLRVFGAKLGLAEPTEDDRPLIEALLTRMAEDGADFTRTFAALADGRARDEVIDRADFDAWARGWEARAPDPALMARANPKVIPRNHFVEAAIAAAVEGEFAPFRAMLAAVTDPFTDDGHHSRAPAEEERVRRTFCGT